MYGRRVRYSVLEFDELLDSSSIDSKGWTLIARTISRNYQLFDGFVVLHGTDSLAYTSAALSFMLQHLGKPVVLTGSQVPMLELQTDATDNLLSSLIVAGHFMIPEVCLLFNHRLFRGNRTTKVSATAFDAFESRNLPPLAVVQSLRTTLNWPLVLRPTQPHAFSIHAAIDTAAVASLRIFPGIRPEMVDAVLHVPGLRGLVLETFGAGNAPGGPDSALVAAFANAIRRGVVVVSVTQCLHGSVSPVYASGTALSNVGVVFGADMTTEAALTKLAYLLALPGATPARVARDMAVALRGELTEAAPTRFQHPDGDGEGGLEGRGVRGELVRAIAEGDRERVAGVLRERSRYVLNEPDGAGNTPLVSGRLPIIRFCFVSLVATESSRQDHIVSVVESFFRDVASFRYPGPRSARQCVSLCRRPLSCSLYRPARQGWTKQGVPRAGLTVRIRRSPRVSLSFCIAVVV